MERHSVSYFRGRRERGLPPMSRITRGLLVLAVVVATGVTGGRAIAAPTLRTFESDPVGQVPPGCTTPSGAAPAVVSSARGHDSARSLRLDDPSTTTITK